MDIYSQMRLARYNPPSVRMPLTKLKVWVQCSPIGGGKRCGRKGWFCCVVVAAFLALLGLISLIQSPGVISQEKSTQAGIKTDNENEPVGYIVKEEIAEVLEEPEASLDFDWPIHVPINLSLSDDNVDITRMRSVGSLLERFSMTCSYLSLMEQFGFIACPYTEDGFSDAETDTESARMAPLLWRLFKNDDRDFIDIGASIGLHTLAAASVGRRVVAVEPVKANQKRLVQAAIANRHSEQILLVPYAVSNSRIKLRLRYPRDNPAKAYGVVDADCASDSRYLCSAHVPTLVLDELLPFIPFNVALLRMGTSNYALEAVTQSRRFLVNIEVPVICMTWTQYTRRWTAGDKERLRVTQMVKQMVKMNYEPRDDVDQALSTSEWGSWPEVIFWTNRGSE